MDNQKSALNVLDEVVREEDTGNFIYADEAKTKLERYIGDSPNVTIPDGIMKIGECAFEGCTFLETVKLPDSVRRIGPYAFEGCKSLQSIELPDSVVNIGWGAFMNCISLQSMIIPEGVTIIDTNAFAYCHSLDIIIPDSVTYIGGGAFWEVPHIEYHGDVEGAPWFAKSMN